MQIVGMSCSKCTKVITFAAEGRGCIKCNRAYHTACIQEARLCPSCGDDLDQQAAVAQRQERAVAAASLSAGRVQFAIGAILLGVLMLCNLVASLILSEFPSVLRFSVGIGALVTIGLLVAVYFGHLWARVVVGLQLALGILVQVACLHRIGKQSGFWAAIFASSVLGIFVACFILLCLSPSVSAYLESHRKQPGP